MNCSAMNPATHATVRLIAARDAIVAELSAIRPYLNWAPAGSPARSLVWEDWNKTLGRLIRMDRRVNDSMMVQ